MQISCPRCSTTYELDERLLPPSGAPVQCTRCSHVFNAAPPGGTARAQTPREVADGSSSDGTQIYGRRSPSVGGASHDDAAAASAPNARTTQVFGAVAAPPQGARVPPTTQMFGAVAQAGSSAPPPSVPPTTQVFGTAAPPQTAGPRVPATTQMFGAVGAHAQSPAQPSSVPSTTQVFGTAAAPPQTTGPRVPATTQVFGAAFGRDPSPAEAPSTPRTTQQFGVIAPVGAGPGGAQPQPRTTQMFGALATPSGGAAGRTADPRATQVFGSGAAAGAITPAVFDDREEKDVSMQSGRFFVAPERRSEDAAGFRPNPSPSPTPSPDPSPEPFPSPAPGPNPSPIPDLRRARTTESPAATLPFEPFPSAFDPPQAFGRAAQSQGDDEDPSALILAGRARRRNVMLGALAAVVVAGVGYVGYGAWKSRAVALPPEAMAAHDEAFTSLRRDDTASLARAEQSLEAVVQQWPAYTEARAAHLTALLFQLDDVRMQIDQLNQQSTELNKQIARFKERKVPSDWENRVNALIDRIGVLKRESDPLVDRATALDAEVNAAFRALQERMSGSLSPEQERALVRAQALYFGVKGSDQAVALSERFRVLGGTGGWGEVGYAEYALNARVAPQTRRQAKEALEALKSTDSTFIRLYVLIGRLALLDKDPAMAVSAFETAATLNPEHAVAAQLLKIAQKQRAAAEDGE